MKKISVIIFSLLIVVLCIGFFIPAAYQTSSNSNISITTEAAFRTFGNYKNPTWWPGKVEADSNFTYQGYNFHVTTYQINSASLITDYKGITIEYVVSLVQVGTNQVQLTKTASFQLSTNPFKKVLQSILLSGAEKLVTEIHQSIEQFFGKTKNIYGMDISQQKVKDSALISVKDVFDHYPNTTDIYKQVNELKNYILEKKGKEVNYPFLHIRKLDSLHYESMVAIATEIQLPESTRYKVKKMVLGNILFSVVTGGLSAIKEAEKQMEYYVFDNRKSSPAIPFQSLITDRSAEADSNKWQTGIYYPIFR